MAGIGVIVGLVGAAVSAVGTIAQGQAQANALNFEAKQYKIKAQESVAASQRDAIERTREKEMLQSRLQAGAAASGAGAGALDPTVVQLASDIEGQGTYGAEMELYKGKELARGYRMQAEADQMSAQAAKTGSYFGAFGTIVGGLSSFASKYGYPAPDYQFSTLNKPRISTLNKPRIGYGYAYGAIAFLTFAPWGELFRLCVSNSVPGIFA